MIIEGNCLLVDVGNIQNRQFLRNYEHEITDVLINGDSTEIDRQLQLTSWCDKILAPNYSIYDRG